MQFRNQKSETEYYYIRGTRGRVFTISVQCQSGPGSSVNITTGYGLEGPEIEFRWGGDFSHLSRPALGPTHLPIQWVPGLSRGKERSGRAADPSPPSSPVAHERAELNLYSLYGS
jgi:hypothetical protein